MDTKIIMLSEYQNRARAQARRFSSTDHLSLKKDGENIIAEAYNWAISAQKKYGIVAVPINLTGFDGDKLTYDSADVYVSVFYDEQTETAILRRDWDDGFMVQYNVLVNYAELQKTAPHSMEELLENGVKLYKRYRKSGF